MLKESPEIATPSKVCVVILNYNGTQDTLECIASLHQSAYPHLEIVIVDNHSHPSSVSALKQTLPDIPILEMEKNLGFAEGNNVGIRYALKKGADYVLLLNNDTIVESNFLEPLVNAAETDDRIGIVGSKILFFDTPTIIQAAGMDVIWGFGTFNRQRGAANKPQHDRRRLFHALTGCIWLVKRQVFENVGFLNPDYFLYAEDAEFCWRVQKKYHILYEPTSVIYHKENRSSPSSAAQGRIVYYCTRNKCYFMKTKGSFFEFLFFLPHYFITRSCKALIWYVKGEKEKSMGVYKGFADFFRGRVGPLPS